VPTALAAQDGAAMLTLVDELERNGGSPQHFSRELSRYLRNLLVVKIAGKDSRLLAASPAERNQMAEIAASFGNDDLTRYLQFSLDLFRDLQFSLQPRFHLELGLLKMVQAGNLVSIEEAIANLGAAPAVPAPPTPRPASVTAPPPVRPMTAPPVAARPVSAPPPAPPRPPAPSPFDADRIKRAGAPPPPAASAAAPSSLSAGADWRQMLHGALTETGLQFSADAIAQSEVAMVGNELVVTTAKSFQLDLGREEILTALKHLGQPGIRFKVVFGEVKAAPVVQAKPVPKDDETTERALNHPEIQRFRETFGGEVRTVRNLKEQ
jgi:DNA polymerase-3 subunit gamma/tau